MAAGSLFCKKYFFSQGPACQMPAGGLFCNSSLLLEVLWLIRMQSYICTMIIAILRHRLKVDIDGECGDSEAAWGVRRRTCREIPAFSRLRALFGALDGLKTQPQPQGAGDLQECCKGGVAVF